MAAALGLGSKMALESVLLVLLLLFHGLTHVTLFVVVVGKTRSHAQAADTQPAHSRTLTRTEGNGYHQNGYKHHPVAAHFHTLIHTLEVVLVLLLLVVVVLHTRTRSHAQNGYHQNGCKRHPVAAHLYTLIHTHLKLLLL